MILHEDLHQSLQQPVVVLVYEALALRDSQLFNEYRKFGAIDLLFVLADVLVEVSCCHGMHLPHPLLGHQIDWLTAG